MSGNRPLLISSTIYGQIMAARMSEHERREALQAMRHAEAIVDGLLWAKRAIEHAAAWLFLKPSLKA